LRRCSLWNSEKNAIVREMPGTIWASRRIMITTLSALCRKRARPYAAGRDMSRVSTTTPTETIRLSRILGPIVDAATEKLENTGWVGIRPGVLARKVLLGCNDATSV
jgi:hypothetical protein